MRPPTARRRLKTLHKVGRLLGEHRRGIARTEDAIKRYIVPELGRFLLTGEPDQGTFLSRPIGRSWHQEIAKRPVKLRARAAEVKTRELATEEGQGSGGPLPTGS